MLSAVNTVVDVHTCVSELYSVPLGLRATVPRHGRTPVRDREPGVEERLAWAAYSKKTCTRLGVT